MIRDDMVPVEGECGRRREGLLHLDLKSQWRQWEEMAGGLCLTFFPSVPRVISD